MCLWCRVVSYWICQAAWRQAGRPQWGEGCRPRGHSERKARPERRDLPGTPLPRCFQTPGAKTQTGISHPLAANPATDTVGDNGSTVRAFRCTEARPPSHIHKSCTMWGVLCGGHCTDAAGEHTNACCYSTVHKKLSFFCLLFPPHIHLHIKTRLFLWKKTTTSNTVSKINNKNNILWHLF